MKSIQGRQLLFFRAKIDPSIGAMPKNAIHSLDVKTMEITDGGVYVETHKGIEHFVPFGNISTITLKPVTEKKNERN